MEHLSILDDFLAARDLGLDAIANTLPGPVQGLARATDGAILANAAATVTESVSKTANERDIFTLQWDFGDLDSGNTA